MTLSMVGATSIGQQASTYGQQAARGVSTFAENNNINTPGTGSLADSSAKAARILQAFIGKFTPPKKAVLYAHTDSICM
jgi:hypothetical protein